jgi:Ca2+-binding RTX toxin-like protein
MEVRPCGSAMTLFLNAGDSVTFDCGSVAIVVEEGDGISGLFGSSTIAMGADTSAIFDSDGSLLSISVADGSVSVTVDLPGADATVVFPPATSGTLNTTNGALTDVSGDGVTVSVGGVEAPAPSGNSTLIQGGLGSTTIKGTAGNDVIIDAGGNNTIKGNGGNDSITTSSGNDAVDGGDGDDIINAGDGNNAVKGGSGNDTITAGSGNDSIDGGAGNLDTCDAGTGKDSVKNCP